MNETFAYNKDERVDYKNTLSKLKKISEKMQQMCDLWDSDQKTLNSDLVGKDKLPSVFDEKKISHNLHLGQSQNGTMAVKRNLIED